MSDNYIAVIPHNSITVPLTPGYKGAGPSGPWADMLDRNLIANVKYDHAIDKFRGKFLSDDSIDAIQQQGDPETVYRLFDTMRRPIPHYRLGTQIGWLLPTGDDEESRKAAPQPLFSYACDEEFLRHQLLTRIPSSLYPVLKRFTQPEHFDLWIQMRKYDGKPAGNINDNCCCPIYNWLCDTLSLSSGHCVTSMWVDNNFVYLVDKQEDHKREIFMRLRLPLWLQMFVQKFDSLPARNSYYEDGQPVGSETTQAILTRVRASIRKSYADGSQYC